MIDILLNKTNRTYEIKIKTRDNLVFLEILAEVKSLDGRVFKPQYKIWEAPVNEANREMLRAMKEKWNKDSDEILPADDPLPEIEEEPQGTWVEPWKDVVLTKQVPEYCYPYQIECLKFLKYRNGCGIIGDEMGTGKTVEALAFLKMSKQLPALIVVPATIKRQWYSQYRKFVDADSNIDILHGQTPYQLMPKTSYIINWDILSHWEGELAKCNFRTIIADEAHRAGGKSNRYKSLKKLCKQAPYKLLMSGTPIKSRPKQFFNLLNIVAPEKFDNEWKFLNRYCDPKHNGFGWVFDGASNIKELYEEVRCLMIRRLKKDVMQDLPDKQTAVLALPIDANNSKYLESVTRFKNSIGLEAQEAFSNMKLEAFALKQSSVVDWLSDFVDNGEKILVGTYHRKVIEFLSSKFKKNSVHIYGGVTANQRQQAIDDFMNKDEVKLLFGQILSAGEGIDGLQDVCSNVAFVEFAHNPTDHDQFTDRLHRGSQKNAVNVYYLIAENTIEEDIAELLDMKRSVIDGVVDGVVTAETNFITYLKNKARCHEDC